MLATAHAACLIGIEANPVQVEVRLGEGLPGFDIVGLPERGVRESRIWSRLVARRPIGTQPATSGGKARQLFAHRGDGETTVKLGYRL